MDFKTFINGALGRPEKGDTVKTFGLRNRVSGYILTKASDGIVRRIPCRHRPEDMTEELRILVDNGCLIKDVIVEHPIYGQLVGQLDISTRHDVDEFIAQVFRSDAAPLSDLTGGIHLHTIVCPDEETYDRVLEKLRSRGFIFEDHN